MHSQTGNFVNAITITLETYIGYVVSAIINIFKFIFCEYDLNGNITGLNILGSIAVLLLAFTIIMILVRKLIEIATPWHHDKEFIESEMEDEAIKDPTIITEDEDYKLTHQFYLKERRQQIENKIKVIRLKEKWNQDKNKK